MTSITFPDKIPLSAQDLIEYRPEDLPESLRWKGEGPPPAKWFAADGTLVYRSYADYCWD